MTTQREINRLANHFNQKTINEKIQPPKIICQGNLFKGGGGGTGIYRARCVEDAGSSNIIHVNLYDKKTGIEITTGTNGVDYNIPVYCNINGGTALNVAVPRLEEDDEIDVHQEIYDNSGTPTKRWKADGIFAGSVDCICNT